MNDYGRTFYEAFARAMGWRTPGGDVMPLWEELSHVSQAAFGKGAEAVVDAFFEDADPPDDSHPASGEYWVGT